MKEFHSGAQSPERNNIAFISQKSSATRLNQDILSAKIEVCEEEESTNYLVEKT